jgi:hypothetical protein
LGITAENAIAWRTPTRYQLNAVNLTSCLLTLDSPPEESWVMMPTGIPYAGKPSK